MIIEKLYKAFIKSKGVTTDSRNVFPESIFFALKGERFDGNKYAAEAINKGASYAVIDNPVYKKNEKYIAVDDVLHSLQSLASHHVQKLKPRLKVVGLTGSNGKTTTKELITGVLSRKYNVGFTKGNLNNHIGVPLTLLSLTDKYEIAVIEMGANGVGEIGMLSNIATPDYGLITNIGKAHLEGFGSVEGIIKGKHELFEYINKTGGTCFINANSKEILSNSGKFNCNKIYFGFHNSTSIDGAVKRTNTPFLQLEINDGNTKFDVATQIIGDYNLDNVLAAMAIGKYFGVSPEVMKEAVEQYEPKNNRSQFIQTSKNAVVMDAYNANPTSMEASISNFLKREGTKKMVILGEMKELGEHSFSAHQKIVELLHSHNVISVLVGKEFKPFHQNSDIIHFDNTEKLIEWIKFKGILDTEILIKGSRSNQLEKIIEYL